MSGPYVVIPDEANTWGVVGPGMLPHEEHSVTILEAEAFELAGAMNAAFAAGQEAERKRVADRVRWAAKKSCILCCEELEQLADELEKGGVK